MNLFACQDYSRSGAENNVTKLFPVKYSNANFTSSPSYAIVKNVIPWNLCRQLLWPSHSALFLASSYIRQISQSPEQSTSVPDFHFDLLQIPIQIAGVLLRANSYAKKQITHFLLYSSFTLLSFYRYVLGMFDRGGVRMTTAPAFNYNLKWLNGMTWSIQSPDACF